MRGQLDPEGESLTLVFDGKETVQAYCADVRQVGGLQVALDRSLAQYDVVAVVFEVEGSAREAFKAYVARVSEPEPGTFETAFVLQDWSADSERELHAWLEAPRESTADDEGDAKAPGKSVDPPPAGRGEVRGVAAVHRIQQMNMGQKAIHAQRADRAERQVLLRDNAPQVLQNLLVNPRIEGKEVLRIAKSSYATGAILQRIAGDSRWGKNKEILAAIVRNPKSPTLVVTRLVDKLRTSDLRMMAKMSSGLKEVVRKAALREYMKRSGQ